MHNRLIKLVNIIEKIKSKVPYQEITIGEGPLNPRAVIIGEALGKDEQTYLRPFIGRSGQLLRKTLDRYAYIDELFFSNVVQYRPEDNRTPTMSEIKEFGKFLKEILDVLKPKVILLVGKIPESFYENFELGFEHQVSKSYHPAFILRQNKFYDKFEEQIKNFAFLIK